MTFRFFVTLLILASASLAASLAFGLTLTQTWPFILASAGAAGLHAGRRTRQRFSASFTVPSLVFLFLAAFFSLFSFRLIPMRLKDFVVAYWLPLLAACLALTGAAALALRRLRDVGTKPGRRP
ncbi:hypothetical protein LWX53_07225 [bacterium]|nr:hypothetical protein [bacterium]